METRFVKPADGLKVRDPATRKHLPQAGANVPLDSYWRRRLRDGDVVEVKTAPKADRLAKKES